MVLAVESAASARLLAARKSSAHSGTATLQEGRSTVPRRLRRPAVKRPVSRCLVQRRVSQLDPDARVPQPFAARSYSRWKALVGGYLGQRIVPCLQDPEEMDAAIQPVGKKAWAHAHRAVSAAHGKSMAQSHRTGSTASAPYTPSTIYPPSKRFGTPWMTASISGTHNMHAMP